MGKVFAAVALICASVSFSSWSALANASEADLKSLVDAEKSQLDAVGDAHVDRLISDDDPESEPRRKLRGKPLSLTLAWLDSQPKASGDAQWKCLTEALYFEARGETVKGQFAVAEVIMNRVKSTRFPSTLCAVINQGTGQLYQCQFTYTCDGRKEVIAEPRAYERVAKVARATLDGIGGDLTKGATHYHTKFVRPSWSRVYTKTTAIGVHIFYRHTYRTASTE